MGGKAKSKKSRAHKNAKKETTKPIELAIPTMNQILAEASEHHEEKIRIIDEKIKKCRELGNKDSEKVMMGIKVLMVAKKKVDELGLDSVRLLPTTSKEPKMPQYEPLLYKVNLV
ncbi:unnamed protein product [Caenorhabditis bovis]|uniref:Uncharacterized protein n=1 Tax=Caenorhabditis bovis TaxID=2654633 RepID=A0A8S1EG26_9PELO|nr:unnamed protein product [Caenorhabditis bovis]